jgi:hypothetical protein
MNIKTFTSLKSGKIFCWGKTLNESVVELEYTKRPCILFDRSNTWHRLAVGLAGR